MLTCNGKISDYADNAKKFYNMRTWQYIKILVCTFVILLCNNIVFAQGEYGYIDVVTSTSSSGALMYVDGNFMSTVPALVRISEGKHIFSFQKDGYISYEQECIIKADRTLCMSINLHGSGKDVTLKTVKYAEIWIDGNYVSDVNLGVRPVIEVLKTEISN